MLNEKNITNTILKNFCLITSSSLPPDFNLNDRYHDIVKRFSNEDLLPKHYKSYKDFIIALIKYRGLTKKSNNNEIIKDSNSNNTYADIFKYLNQGWASKCQGYYKDIFLVAVRQNGLSLYHVNPAWVLENSDKYKEVVQVAVKQNPMALKHINTTWVTSKSREYNEIVKNLLDEAFKNNGDYYRIALAAVQKDGAALKYVDQNWALENPKKYCGIASVAVNQDKYAFNYVDPAWALDNPELYSTLAEDGRVLKYVDQNWALKNPELYFKIALASVHKNEYSMSWNKPSLQYVPGNWALKNPELYFKIALASVHKDEYSMFCNKCSLQYVPGNWALKNPELYFKIALVAVNKDGAALKHVPWSWASRKPQLYFKIALAAVQKDESSMSCNKCSLQYVPGNWALKNPELYFKIALVAVNKDGLALKYVYERFKNNIYIFRDAINQNRLAFQYAGEDFYNDINIAIWSLMAVDREYLSDNYEYYKIVSNMISKREPSKKIEMYLYMLSNKNVSNIFFKNALCEFFIRTLNCEFSPDQFALYKNIFKYYLALCYKGEKNFLKQLSTEEANKLYAFLSVADPSALKNSQLATEHDGSITEYLRNNKDHVKCMKNLNMYLYLLPNHLSVIDNTKIIEIIQSYDKNPMNKIKQGLITQLVLSYCSIEDLLKLYDAFKVQGRLVVKYFKYPTINLEFSQEGYTSTGITALADAVIEIASNNGCLKYTGACDPFNATYDILNIDLALFKKIEVTEIANYYV